MVTEQSLHRHKRLTCPPGSLVVLVRGEVAFGMVAPTSPYPLGQPRCPNGTTAGPSHRGLTHPLLHLL